MVEGRTCNKCLEHKPWESFAINKKGVNDRKSVCKECSNKAQRLLNKKRRIDDPLDLSKTRRAKHLKINYGMSLEDYENLLVKQDYKCAICGREDNGLSNQKQLYIDHCHTKGHVRGLLCYYCNTILGLSFDDTDILRKAIKYLNKERSLGQ